MSASIDTYRAINVGTANPRQVILKMYDAGIRFLAEAEDALSRGEPYAEALGNARTIVSGLMASLNFEAGELAHNLLRIYLFAMDRIHTTGAEQRDAGLAEARQALETLRSGWEQMPVGELAAVRPANSHGVNLRG